MSDGEWVENFGIVRPRGDNAIARHIAAGERELEVLCHEDSRRRAARGVLVAAVADGALWGDGKGWPRSTHGAGVAVVTECRCSHHHKLDLAKVWEATDRLRHRSQKARRVDVRTVAAA